MTEMITETGDEFKSEECHTANKEIRNKDGFKARINLCKDKNGTLLGYRD
jgi:hypothetical protein